MKIEYELGNKFTGFEFVGNGECIITRVSPYNSEEYKQVMMITQDQYNKWRHGALIQNAFPNLTADEREFILTGLTKEQFDILYKDDE